MIRRRDVQVVEIPSRDPNTKIVVAKIIHRLTIPSDQLDWPLVRRAVMERATRKLEMAVYGDARQLVNQMLYTRWRNMTDAGPHWSATIGTETIELPTLHYYPVHEIRREELVHLSRCIAFR